MNNPNIGNLHLIKIRTLTIPLNLIIMKTITLYGLLLYSAALLINSSCTDDTLPTVTSTNTVPSTNTIPPASPPNSASTPSAYAGQDFQVILPTNFCYLSGGYSENKNIKVVKTLWKKISGSSSGVLQSPDSLRTKVSNLEKGIYEFELTITNMLGLIGKDTVRVIVGEMSKTPKEIIFKDMEWIFPWYSTIELKNFNLLMPDSIFKVYIKRGNNPQWEEVPFLLENTATKYEYFVETRPDGAGMYAYGSLYIFYYGIDTDDTPSVKIMH